MWNYHTNKIPLHLGKMDDVLDCLCLFHLHWNIHRHIPFMVSLLLWSQGGYCPVAAIASHKGQFHIVSQVRASHADTTWTGGIVVLYILLYVYKYHYTLSLCLAGNRWVFESGTRTRLFGGAAAGIQGCQLCHKRHHADSHKGNSDNNKSTHITHHTHTHAHTHLDTIHVAHFSIASTTNLPTASLHKIEKSNDSTENADAISQLPQFSL